MIAIGSDHAGWELKKALMAHLEEIGEKYIETGCTDGKSIDYPAVARDTCELVISGKADRAVLICGTGIGISISANKVKGIRAALCTDCYMAKYTRLHNDANVLCLGGRVIGEGLATEILDTFLSTGFEGGRHQRRIDMIADIENEAKYK